MLSTKFIKQNKTKQNKTKQNKTKQNKTKQNKTVLQQPQAGLSRLGVVPDLRHGLRPVYFHGEIGDPLSGG